MRCPNCGAEIPEGNVCGSCGRKTSRPDEIEVQYRDFKISEMLDIKISPRGSGRKEQVKPSPQQPKAAEKSRRQDVKRERKKTASTILIAIIIILFAAASWYFLIRFFVRS